MKKGIIAIVIIVIVVVGAILVFGRKKADAPASTTPATSNSTTTPSTTTASSSSVTIENFAFDAKTITVKKGTAVTWTNKDSAAHTVTFDDASLSSASSGNLNNGDTFSHTFDTVGSFDYHCAIHSSMTGTVVVTE